MFLRVPRCNDRCQEYTARICTAGRRLGGARRDRRQAGYGPEPAKLRGRAFLLLPAPPSNNLLRQSRCLDPEPILDLLLLQGVAKAVLAILKG